MKKLNNKGFTLIEILATIAIMAIIATMTTVNMTKIFQDKNKITTDNKNSVIENAACVYIELKENQNLKKECKKVGCNIKSEVLIKRGLLNETDVDKNQDINIYYEKNEKMCKIKEV